MTVLVTGGAGFVAATLIGRLLKRGDTVLAFDNLCRGSLSNIGKFLSHKKFHFENVDLSTFADFKEAMDRYIGSGSVTQVWHLAANSDIPAGIESSEIDLRDTFMTTFNTCKVMEERGIQELLFASSSAIYGDLGDRQLTEDVGPLFPISNYGAMKLASEAAITAAAEKFLSHALLFRFPNVVGVPATHGVILDFIRRLRETPSYLDVLGDGTQRKSYLHVTDLVDAMLMIQERAKKKLDVFNIGPSDEGVFVREIAEATVAAVAPGAQIRYGSLNKGWVGDVPRFSYSTAKIRELGWLPKLNSLEAVRRAIAEIALQEDH